MNFKRLKANFDGQEASYIEKGALRVRVSNICAKPGRISADIEEIPTPGFERTVFHRLLAEKGELCQWSTGGGFLTDFSENTWHAGYGGWSLYFNSSAVRGVVELAAGWPDATSWWDQYVEVVSWLQSEHPDYSWGVMTRVFND